MIRSLILLVFLLQLTTGWANAQSITTTLATIPAAVDVPDPGRGVVQWYGDSLPTPFGPFIAYSRFHLSELEPKVGVYDWTPLDKAISDAESKGEKFSFRVMSYDPGFGPKGGNACPPDFTSGFNFTLNGAPEFVPDWNSPAYIAMFTGFEAACAARYDKDNRIYSVDVGAWGDWNECHDWQVVYPGGFAKPTDATVDDLVAAFSPWRHVHLISMSDDPRVLRVGRGWKRDSLGAIPYTPGQPSHFLQGLHQTPEQWAIVSTAYQFGPIMLEWFGGKMDFQLAAKEAPQIHPSLICSGPMDKWNSYSSTDQASIESIIAGSGFHDEVDSVKYPATVIRGRKAVIASSWSNVGCAPIYDPWDVSWQLSNSSGVVWQAASGIDLRKLTPGTLTEFDTVTVPKSVAPGQYILSVIVSDHTGFWKQLRLADNSRQDDGSYAIGTVLVK